MKQGFLDKLFSIFKRGRGGDLEKYLKMAEEDPEDMRIKLKIGELYFKQKNIDAGINIFTEVAQRYVQEGFFLKAIAIYKNILKVSPGSVQFNEKLAELFAKLNMTADAITQYKIVINYYKTHQMKEDAIRAAKALVNIEPDDMDPRRELAALYNSYGQTEEALREYEAIAKTLRKDMKRIDLLVDIYEKILLKKPEEKGLLLELCIFYLKLRQPQKSIRKIEKLRLEEDPQFKPIYEKAKQLEEKLA